jgi:uncharacterized membrane protein YdbT with pleckstrin-like domain
MLEFGKKYKRGKKTFLFIFLIKCWWLNLIGIGFLYLAWQLTYGGLQAFAQNFLLSHPDWLVTPSMLSQWFLLFGLGILFISYSEASFVYQHYKFILDKYGLHLHRGIFFIHETTIPYRQISNVHIARPYHYTLMGLARLDILTAANRISEPEEQSRKKKYLIPIIDLAVARKLSHHLLKEASKSRHRSEPEDTEDDSDEYEDDDEEETVDNEE